MPSPMPRRWGFSMKNGLLILEIKSFLFICFKSDLHEETAITRIQKNNNIK